MIPIPDERLLNVVPPYLVEHDIIFDCAGSRNERPGSGAPPRAASHRPETADQEQRESMGEGPAGDSQSRPGPSFLRRAAERGGSGTDHETTLAGGSVPPGNDEPGARLAEPLPRPSIFHVLTWLRYHARRRP